MKGGKNRPGFEYDDWKQWCGMHTLWVHQLDAYDRFDNVGDDIVEQEAAVSNEQCHKGHQV